MKICVWKFGGAACKPEIFRLILKLILSVTDKKNKVVVIISAMEGVTRLLRSIFEIVVGLHPKDTDIKELVISVILERFHKTHSDFIDDLFKGRTDDLNRVKINFEKIYIELQKYIKTYERGNNEDKFYAHLLSFGERASSMVLNDYICILGSGSVLFDARDYLFTNSNFREAKIEVLDSSFCNLFNKSKVLVTQGFIGGSNDGTTVLGFDGSDLSAAYFAVTLLEQGYEVLLTFWKNVKGFYSKDPTIYPDSDVRYKMKLSEYEKLRTWPIRVDAVIYAVKRGLTVYMRNFLSSESLEAKIVSD